MLSPLGKHIPSTGLGRRDEALPHGRVCGHGQSMDSVTLSYHVWWRRVQGAAKATRAPEWTDQGLLGMAPHTLMSAWALKDLDMMRGRKGQNQRT